MSNLSSHTSPQHDDSNDQQPLLGLPDDNENINGYTLVPKARLLGPGSAYIIIISRVLGTGIFALPAHILSTVDSRVLALVLWVLGALLSYLSLQVFLEYGCMLPRSGGEKTYLEFAYPRPRWLASTVVAVWVVLGGVSSNNCIVFAKYTLAAAGYTKPAGYMVKVVAALLLTAIVVAHGCFYNAALKLQNLLGIAKIGFIVFVMLTSLYVVVFNPHTMPPSTLPLKSALAYGGTKLDSKISWSVLSTALFRVSYAYSGLENANNILSEVRNPARTLKLVAPLALLTALIAYMLVNLAYFAVIPLKELKESGDLVGLVFFQHVYGTGAGELILSLAVALSAFGNVMVVVFSMARVAREVALQGFLPWGSVLGSTRPFGTPLGGLLVHYIPSLLAIVLPSSATVYVLVADIKGYASQFFILALCIGLFFLRKSHPSLDRPYRAWPLTIIARLFLCCALIVAPLFTARGSSILSRGNLYVLLVLIILGSSSLYWYIHFILLPRVFKYRISEEVSVQEDGTRVIRLVRDKAHNNV